MERFAVKTYRNERRTVNVFMKIVVARKRESDKMTLEVTVNGLLLGIFFLVMDLLYMIP
jgi:hypothetical protein